MPDPAATLHFGVPGYVYIWFFSFVSFFLFMIRAAAYVRVLATGRAEPRWDHPGERLKLFAANVLGQRRLVDERTIGFAHVLIFWSFVLYAGTFIWTVVRAAIPNAPFPYPDEIGWIRALLVSFSVFGLAAIAYAGVRRSFFPPEGLERSRDAFVVLGLITVVLVSSLAMIAARDSHPGLATIMWWLHIITVCWFMAYLPFSKHLHVLAAPFGVLFGSLRPAVMPAPSEGASVRGEFTWRQLFSGLACAECGRCDRACPNVASGADFSPKRLMERMKQVVRAPIDHACDPFLGKKISGEQIWTCATCAACMDRCPTFNEHLPIIIEIRRRLVAEGTIQHSLQTALTSLQRYGNSFACSPKARTRWTTDLGFPIKDARKEPVEYLWLTGDFAAYHPTVRSATRAVAGLFHEANLDVGILYEMEQNSGGDVRRVGEEGLFQILSDRNRQAMEKAHFLKIVTTDPHTYHALKNEYGNGQHRVLHYTEVLLSLLQSDRLHIRHSIQRGVTYHDPCYLGRYNGVYEAPRKVLEFAGADVLEMPHNRRRALCCGAGGGRIWMEESAHGKSRASEIRLREAASVHGARMLVTACPKDLVMFADALKTTGLEGHFEVRDIAEVLESAVGIGRTACKSASTSATVA